ncbi:MAG: histone deacetylase [Gemmatimonadetes bacterium]|nr:histone deacetylase [Gemmatimonadota bacterium]MCH8810394.1 histone deacetylase [Gemmatimonadota bacterium]
MTDSARPVGFLLHPDAPLHDTGWGHPEHQGRLRALASAVGRDLLALHESVVQVEPGQVTEEDLLRVHTPEYLALIRTAVERAEKEGTPISLDADTMVSGASWDAATGSTAALITATGQVADGALASAFVATRPPGHHATPDRAMGFCLINHVAVAARWLQGTGRAERVLIVDWDVHHGNGTQDTFYADGTVFYLSLHQSPHYPGTGAASEKGVGEGTGWTLNVPLPAATSADDYSQRFSEALGQGLEICRPDFILISAGFDVMAGDPLGGMLLEPEDLHSLTQQVMAGAADGSRADDAHRVGVVAALEGGYDPARTGLGAAAVIRALAGIDLD